MYNNKKGGKIGTMDTVSGFQSVALNQIFGHSATVSGHTGVANGAQPHTNIFQLGIKARFDQVVMLLLGVLCLHFIPWMGFKCLL
ncbi:hypothetical protein K7X08_030019 [Anisodus acutangulus]|uniref:Uncharacterized protein n=1 Tax=Anisodus acutangulus TaxID=402998 RepID=A0A9Q1LNS5_9SOLA|nr:hypothetical protein K7X08_030019 [Anisodus acutangulus]